MENGKRWQDIAVVFRYDPIWLKRWMRAGQGKRYWIYMFLLALLAANFLLAIPGAQQKALPSVLAVLCLALLGMVFFRVRAANRKLSSADALYNEGKEYRAFFREDGFSFKSAGRGEENVLYGEKVEVLEMESCFRMTYRENGLFILPKEPLTEEQSAALSHFWSERLGKGYRYA
ncbi:MAG: hypothetical protein HFG26_12930 [Provencibacterium sp.]|jgi:hypothetical protein|nr:hypothetical protein [Provencibacterium sp.]